MTQAYLTSREVLGHVDLLLDRGDVVEEQHDDGVVRYQGRRLTGGRSAAKSRSATAWSRCRTAPRAPVPTRDRQPRQPGPALEERPGQRLVLQPRGASDERRAAQAPVSRQDAAVAQRPAGVAIGQPARGRGGREHDERRRPGRRDGERERRARDGTARGGAEEVAAHRAPRRAVEPRAAVGERRDEAAEHAGHLVAVDHRQQRP